MEEHLSWGTHIMGGDRLKLNMVFSRDCVLRNRSVRIQVQTLLHGALRDQWLACFFSSRAGDNMVFEGP